MRPPPVSALPGRAEARLWRLGSGGRRAAAPTEDANCSKRLELIADRCRGRGLAPRLGGRGEDRWHNVLGPFHCREAHLHVWADERFLAHVAQEGEQRLPKALD